MAVPVNLDEIAKALAAAQARADASGQPEPVGFVARYADGSWVATDGEVQPSSDVPPAGHVPG
jgi:hypothetical protein